MCDLGGLRELRLFCMRIVEFLIPQHVRNVCLTGLYLVQLCNHRPVQACTGIKGPYFAKVRERVTGKDAFDAVDLNKEFKICGISSKYVSCLL
jgi:hypothetical protein